MICASEQLENHRLEGVQISPCISQILKAHVPVLRLHRRDRIHHQMHVVALLEQIEARLAYTDMGFGPVKHHILPLELFKERFDSVVKH